MADETLTTTVADEASAPTTPEPSAPAAESSAEPAAPSDLDAAIARAQAAMESTSAALESDDGVADDAAEAPAIADADEPAADAAPESDDAAAVDGAEDDDTPTITRRNAREIAQKAVEQYAAEKQRADELQAQIAAREAEDGQVVGQILGWVGTNQEYDQIKARAIDLNIDQYERDEAARELQGLDAMRNVYATMYRGIQADHSARLSHAYLMAQALPNVNAGVIVASLKADDLPAAVQSAWQHLHEAGRLTERAEWQAKEQKWQAEQAKLKASYEARLAKAAGRMPSPERGGRSGPSGALEGLIDPRTGLPSDEAEAQWNRGELRFEPAA